MRRALTMIELLLALCLLSAVLLAAGSWVHICSRTASAAAEPLKWESAAGAVLEQVQDDLLIGDYDKSGARVELDGGVLQVRTRATAAGDILGTVIHRYRFEPSARELRLEERDYNGSQRSRRLMSDVAGWEVDIDDESRQLTITMTSSNERTTTRSYRLR